MATGNLTSLGYSAQTKKLVVDAISYEPHIGSLSLELPTNFNLNSIQKSGFDSNGNLKTLGSLTIYSGTDLSTPYTCTSRYSINIDSFTNDFQIFDNVNGVARIIIDATTGITHFNPPNIGAALPLTNADYIASVIYPLFSVSSDTGFIGNFDVTSSIIYNAGSHTLTVPNIKPVTITDRINSTGTSTQLLSSTGTGIVWTSAPVVNNGTLSITSGPHLSGGGTFSANQATSTSIILFTDATSANSASTIVSRDVTGNFSAGTITANTFSGTATNATNATLSSVSSGTFYISGTSGYTNGTNYPIETDNGGRIAFTSGTNILTIGSAVNGSITLTGSGGGISIASSSATAITVPNGTIAAHNITPTTLTDGTSSVGASTQLLSSTGTGLAWTNTPTINNGTLTITNGAHMTGSGSFTANQATATSITLATDATSANTASTIVARDVNKNIGINAVIYWDSINTTHTFSLATISNVLNFSYFNGTTTTIPFSFNGNGVATIPFIKDTTSSNGTTGQYLTAGASGILWATLPAINNGTLTITNGTHMTGSGSFTANQATATSITLATDATSANTVATIVARDMSGNFVAGKITATQLIGDLIGSASLVNTTVIGSTIVYMVFSGTFGTQTGQTLYTNGYLYYTPSSNILNCIAAYANTITVSASASSIQYNVLFGAAGTITAVLSDSTFLYNPYTNFLYAGTFNGAGVGLTGTAALLTSGTTNNINTFSNILGNALYPVMVGAFSTTTSQQPFTDGLGAMYYTPSNQTLNAEYITSNSIPLAWNSDFLYAGYVPSFPSNATLSTYYFIGQLGATGGGSNDATFTFNGVLGLWSLLNGFANLTINFKSRGGFIANGTFNSTGTTLANIIACMDITVYVNAGLFTIWLVVKPAQYWFYNFTMSGLSRDPTCYLATPGYNISTTAPLGTVQMASVLSQLTYTNANGVLTTGTSMSSPVITGTTSMSSPVITGTTSISSPVITGTTSITTPTLSGTTSMTTPLGNITAANIGNTTRYIGGAGLYPCGILRTDAVDGQDVTLQLGKDSTSYRSWFISARNNNTATASQLTFAPYGAPVALTLSGSGNLTLLGNLVVSGTASSNTIVGNLILNNYLNLDSTHAIIPNNLVTTVGCNGVVLSQPSNGIGNVYSTASCYMGSGVVNSNAAAVLTLATLFTQFGASSTGSYRLKLYFTNIFSTLSQTFSLNFCTSAGVAAPANWANNVSQAANGGVASFYGASFNANIPQIGHTISTSLGKPIWEFDFYYPNGAVSTYGGTKLVKGCNGSQDGSYYYTTNVNSIYNSYTNYPGIIISGTTAAPISIFELIYELHTL